MNMSWIGFEALEMRNLKLNTGLLDFKKYYPKQQIRSGTRWYMIMSWIDYIIWQKIIHCSVNLQIVHCYVTLQKIFTVDLDGLICISKV